MIPRLASMIYTIEIRQLAIDYWEVKVWNAQGINFSEGEGKTEYEAREIALRFTSSATKEKDDFRFFINKIT